MATQGFKKYSQMKREAFEKINRQANEAKVLMQQRCNERRFESKIQAIADGPQMLGFVRFAVQQKRIGRVVIDNPIQFQTENEFRHGWSDQK